MQKTLLLLCTILGGGNQVVSGIQICKNCAVDEPHQAYTKEMTESKFGAIQMPGLYEVSGNVLYFWKKNGMPMGHYLSKDMGYGSLNSVVIGEGGKVTASFNHVASAQLPYKVEESGSCQFSVHKKTGILTASCGQKFKYEMNYIPRGSKEWAQQSYLPFAVRMAVLYNSGHPELVGAMYSKSCRLKVLNANPNKQHTMEEDLIGRDNAINFWKQFASTVKHLAIILGQASWVAVSPTRMQAAYPEMTGYDATGKKKVLSLRVFTELWDYNEKSEEWEMSHEYGMVKLDDAALPAKDAAVVVENMKKVRNQWCTTQKANKPGVHGKSLYWPGHSYFAPSNGGLALTSAHPLFNPQGAYDFNNGNPIFLNTDNKNEATFDVWKALDSLFMDLSETGVEVGAVNKNTAFFLSKTFSFKDRATGKTEGALTGQIFIEIWTRKNAGEDVKIVTDVVNVDVPWPQVVA
jgi:hypothetical protein